jgi:transcription-repair coupling factor (superfamily II helicase)
MDRLVCGDVGFGKTEVAIRAALAVDNGKQVASSTYFSLSALPYFYGAIKRHASYYWIFKPI